MKSRSMFHLVCLFAISFSLLGSATTIIPAHANSPTGLSATGWKQILALLPPTQQAYLKASNTGTNDQFGYSIAVSGNTIVVGAPLESSSATGVDGNGVDNSALDSGAVYVFIRNGNTWSQQAYLKASNTGAGDSFGWSVAISGDTIVVGAFGEDSNATGVNGNEADNSAADSGAAYVFVRNGSTWSQQAYLKASNTEAGDHFGSSVAISGDTIVVGATFEDSNTTGVNGNQADNSAVDSGAAYVFTRSGTTWSQQAYLKASNAEAGDGFGYPVAISGDTIVVGAYLEDSSAIGINGNQADNSASFSGAAYVFTRSGSDWSQQAYLKASNTGTLDFFGIAAAISGDTIVVGANGEDSNATGLDGNQVDNSAGDSGAAYIFTRSGSTWSQQAYLKASNTGAGDLFGRSVDISGDALVIGGFVEDSNAIGINGNEVNNSASDSGAAYIFTRTGGVWSQQAYLKASNTGADDYFGFSVAISDDMIVAGAYRESSNATGVNGNEADNSTTGSGAAYAFVIPHTVMFNANGGSGSMSDQVTNSLTALTANAFTRIGYSFSGWNTAADGSGTSYANSAIYDFSADVTLYAQWAPLPNHTVTFNANDGTGSMSPQVTNLPAALTINTFTRAGYSFSSWNTAADGSDTSYADGAIYDFSADVTLYAQWTIANHTVTLNANGGSGSMSPQVNNLPAALTANAFTRTGYSFSGWNTAADGSGTAYANGATYNFSADVTLYAQWSAVNHTVTFNANGGSGSMSPQVNNLPAVLTANTFTRTGYSFSGWNTAANGAGTAYANGSTYDFSADVTLYAQWTVLTPTFGDVPLDYWSWQYIESLYNSGITGGCSTNPLNYCPTASVTRAQMAVFLLKGIHGSSYAPPAVNGSTGFNDVAVDYWAAAWIKQLAAEGITGGCGNGNYCPENTVTRDQMAVFLLKAKYGSSYAPPAVTDTGFTDVPADYWAAAWINQLAAEAITGGCGGGNFCPSQSLPRDQMAVFLQRTFNLPLP